MRAVGAVRPGETLIVECDDWSATIADEIDALAQKAGIKVAVFHAGGPVRPLALSRWARPTRRGCLPRWCR